MTASKYNIFKRTTWTVELILNLLLLALYSIAILAPYISPRISSIPALLNLGFIIIFPIFAFIALTHLLRRRWKYVAIYAVMTVLSFGYIKTYIPLNFTDNPAEPHELRVLTYNVRSFAKVKGANAPSAKEVVLEYDADVVCLQEAVMSQNEKTNNRKLKEAFGKAYPHIDAHFDYVNHSQGLVLLSKYPIVKKRQVEYPTQGNASVIYLIRLREGKTLLIANNHMESYKLSKKEKANYTGVLRNTAVSELPSLLGQIHNRLGSPLAARAFAAERVENEVSQMVKEASPDYIIVAGDMNDTPMSFTYRKIRGGYRDAFAEKGTGIGATYNERFFYFRIDHLFYDGKIEAIRAEVPTRRKSSDHNPLIVDFRFVTE